MFKKFKQLFIVLTGLVICLPLQARSLPLPYLHNALGKLAHTFTTLETAHVPTIEKALEQFMHDVAELDWSDMCGLDSRHPKPGYLITKEIRSVTVARVVRDGILESLEYLGHIDSESLNGSIKPFHLTREVVALFNEYSNKLADKFKPIE